MKMFVTISKSLADKLLKGSRMDAAILLRDTAMPSGFFPGPEMSLVIVDKVRANNYETYGKSQIGVKVSEK